MKTLYDELSDKGFEILAFPCNQFGSQEPGTNEEIHKFATEKMGAKYPIFAKIDVNGSKAIPLYQWLKKRQGGTLGDNIKWNFSKFLVDREGIPVNRYAPNTAPSAIKNDIEALL